MSKWRFSVLLTPISMLSKSTNTAIFNLSSTITNENITNHDGLLLRNLDDADFVHAARRNVDLVAFFVGDKVAQHTAAGWDRPGHETVVLGIKAHLSLIHISEPTRLLS